MIRLFDTIGASSQSHCGSLDCLTDCSNVRKRCSQFARDIAREVGQPEHGEIVSMGNVTGSMFGRPKQNWFGRGHENFVGTLCVSIP